MLVYNRNIGGEQMEKMYKLIEIAEMLNYNIETVRRKVRSGKINAVKFGGEYRVSESELKKYMQKGE